MSNKLKYLSAFNRYVKTHKAEALYLWTLTVCMVPNVVLSAVEPMGFMARITNVVLPLGILWSLMNVTRRTGILILSLFPLMFFDAFQLVLLCIYGRSVIGIDMLLNVETTNPSEAWELLSHIWPELSIVILMYLLPLGFSIVATIRKWRIRSSFRHRSLVIGGYVCMAGVGCFLISYLVCKPYRPTRELFPYNVGCNIFTATQRSEAVMNYPATSASFRFHASDTDSVHGRTVIVVIGETSRADNWSMFGYSYPTSEALDTLPGIYPFSAALSESNTTHKSVPILLTHLDATNFGDSVYFVKALPAAFNEAGWDTYFFSNQQRNHGLIDMMASQANMCAFIKDREGKEARDEALIPYLQAALKTKGSDRLVILHTYGSHFNYEDRYDKARAMFPDASTSSSSAKNRDGLVKAYDNTIQYTTRLLRSIIREAERNGGEAVVIYTSDHGEDLYDDERKLFLHASPLPSYYQLHVPFLVWLSPDYEKRHPETAATLRANSLKSVSSSASFFPTILSLAGISTPYLDMSRSLASPAYKESAHLYVNDYNESVNLRDAGFDEIDFRMLEKLRKR